MRRLACLLPSAAAFATAAVALVCLPACHKDTAAPVAVKVGPRPLDLALYLPAPASGDLVRKVQEAVRTRFPGIDLHTAPPMGTKPPMGLVFAPPIEDFPPPAPDLLAHFTRGLTPAQVPQVSAAKGVVVFSSIFDDDPTYSRLRTGDEVLADLATGQSGFVWDQDTREMFAPEAWQKQRIDGWEGNLPFARRHISIHQYEFASGHYRAITLGMAKFGLPDLAVDDAPLEQTHTVDWLLGALAQTLVEGGAPDAKGEIVVDVDAFHHLGARNALTAETGQEKAPKIGITFHSTKRESSDPTNRMMSLGFPGYAGTNDAERQAKAMRIIVGGGDPNKVMSVAASGRDPEMEAVMKRVQERLPALGDTFRKGLPAGDHLEVKAPFDSDDQSVEWVWVDVTEWKDSTTLHGTLHSAPRAIHALHQGTPVELRQSQISDYVWKTALGTRKEGGDGVDILNKRGVDSPQP